MKRPRFSLAAFALAVAALGAEFALLRSVVDDPTPGRFREALAIVSPMALALAYGLRLRIWRTSSPFWHGFLLIGTPSTIVLFLALWLWFDTTVMTEFYWRVVDPIILATLAAFEVWAPATDDAVTSCVGLLVISALYSALAAGPALLAGWLFGRHRITIAFQRRPTTVDAPETQEPDSVSATNP